MKSLLFLTFKVIFYIVKINERIVYFYIIVSATAWNILEQILQNST